MPTSQDTKTDCINNLIMLIENLNEPAGIKDLTSRHIYMNKAAYKYTNTPYNLNIEGLLDEEFPADWVELSDGLKEHDRKTQNTLKRVSVIETHYWNGSTTLVPFISDKIPIYDQNKICIGTLWTAHPFRSFSPLILINQKKPSVLVTEINVSIFTKSELDTIFLLLQRFSNKEIAKRMNVSYKTIENRIYTMYQKAGAHSLGQFEAFCHGLGLDNYVPPSLILKGIQFI